MDIIKKILQITYFKAYKYLFDYCVLLLAKHEIEMEISNARNASELIQSTITQSKNNKLNNSNVLLNFSMRT
jgi:hypothetical protein